MAVAMVMKWAGVTPDQYEEARSRVGWETTHPEGAIFHVARFVGGDLHVLDVWESEEDFDRFATDRLIPVTTEIGIAGQPDVQFERVHAYFNPAAVSAGAAA